MPSQQDMLEDAAAYAEKKQIFQLFESLLQEVVVHQPDKPIDHLIKVLKRTPVPKVVVAGPPGAQVRALCEKLAAKTQLVHVVAGDVYRELARQNVPSALEAKALVDQGKGVPSATTLEMLKEKLLSADCLKYGWVLEGFPADPIEARLLAQGGLLPTRFLHINVADAEASRRLTGRVVDEKEATVYHLEDAPPPAGEIASRCVRRDDDSPARVGERIGLYRRAMEGVFPCFEKVLVELDGGVAGEAGVAKLLDAALPTVTSDMPTRAPRGCPRVALLGGPGSNAEGVGAALAATYGAKLISAMDLLHGASLNGSKAAAKAMAMPEPLHANDKLLSDLVLQRLSLEDVRRAGFVLVGFPASREQAALLKKGGVWIRHAVHLDMSAAAAEAALCGTRYDPFDGETYHVATNPAPDAATAARLVTHPKHEPAAVKKALKTWAAHKGALLKAFSAELSTEDATRPEAALVERLAGAFLQGLS